MLAGEISEGRIVLIYEPESKLRYFGARVPLYAHTRGVIRFESEYVARA